MKEIKYIDGKLYRECGWISSEGYLKFSIDGKAYYAHRYLYEKAHGLVPRHLDVDHIDGDKLNNNLDNLRAVPREVNALNRHRANINNKIGVRGVSYHAASGKFQAQYKGIYLGIHDTVEEAELAILNFKEI